MGDAACRHESDAAATGRSAYFLERGGGRRARARAIRHAALDR
jgi:hypothetical protein